MASALEEAKEKYRNKKSRLNMTSSQLRPATPDQEAPIPAAIEVSRLILPRVETYLCSIPFQIIHAPSTASEDFDVSDTTSLAQRRSRRTNRQPPLRYRDDRPVAPASLPIPVQPLQPTMDKPPPLPISKCPKNILKSPSNLFGLFRQYLATSFPDHDPESDIQAEDLSDATVDHSEVSIVPASLFRPYPNYNAFQLGEWYWNNSIQKTKDDFQKLINIISGEGFSPADIRNINWDSINRCLGDTADSGDIWLDELDAGWKETSITLSIPFHRNTPNPGLQQYTCPPFRHRSIVSVLREKMANSHMISGTFT